MGPSNDVFEPALQCSYKIVLIFTLIKESYHDVDNPDQLRVLAFSTLS